MAVFKLSDIIAAEDKARRLINDSLQTNAMTEANEQRRVNGGKPWSEIEWEKDVNRRKKKHELIRDAIVKAYPEVSFSGDYSKTTVWPSHEDNATIEIDGLGTTEAEIPYIKFEGTMLFRYIPPNVLTSMYEAIEAAHNKQPGEMENLENSEAGQKKELDNKKIPQQQEQAPSKENISVADQYVPAELFKLWEDLNNKLQALLEKHNALIFSNDDIINKTYEISDLISELKNNLVTYSNSHKLSEKDPEYNYNFEGVYNLLETRIKKLNKKVEDLGVFLEQSSLKGNDKNQHMGQGQTYDEVKNQAQKLEDDHNELRSRVKREKVILTTDQITKSDKIVYDTSRIATMLENKNTADLVSISKLISRLKQDVASLENDLFKPQNQPPKDPRNINPNGKPRSLNLTNLTKTYADPRVIDVVKVKEQVYEDRDIGILTDITTKSPIYANIEKYTNSNTGTNTSIKRASAVYTFDIPEKSDEKIQLAKAAVASALELGQKSPLVIGGADTDMILAAVKVCEASGISYGLPPGFKFTQAIHADMEAFKKDPKAKAVYEIKTDDYSPNMEAPADRVAKNIAQCDPAVNPGPQKVVTKPVAQQHVQNTLKDNVEKSKQVEIPGTQENDDSFGYGDDDTESQHSTHSTGSATTKPTINMQQKEQQEKMKNQVNDNSANSTKPTIFGSFKNFLGLK